MAIEPRTFRHEFRSDTPLSAHDRYARARMARAEAIADVIVAAVRRLRALALRVAAWRRDARARRELAALSDRILADIGITRSDIRRPDLSTLARERAESRLPARAAALQPANRNDARPKAA